MYRAFGLLQTASDLTLGETATRLQAKFPGYSVTLNEAQITVAKGDWEIELLLNGGDRFYQLIAPVLILRTKTLVNEQRPQVRTRPPR